MRILFLALLAVILEAQELGMAILSGDATDPQGAGTNAHASVKSTDTGIERATVSSNFGLFVCDDLTPPEADGASPFC